MQTSGLTVLNPDEKRLRRGVAHSYPFTTGFPLQTTNYSPIHVSKTTFPPQTDLPDE